MNSVFVLSLRYNIQKSTNNFLNIFIENIVLRETLENHVDLDHVDKQKSVGSENRKEFTQAHPPTYIHNPI